MTTAAQPTIPELDLDRIRACFPGLASETMFLDNAGGSQMPSSVIESMIGFVRRDYVQSGAEYEESRNASGRVSMAHEIAETMMNSVGVGKVALGPSSSVMLRLLADSYADVLDAHRDEIVVCEAGHESNVGPWLRMSDFGYEVRLWRAEEGTGASTLEGLNAVLNDRTKIVAIPHVSNLLGGIEDIASFTKRAHEVGARVVVDGVAYAPHRPMDMKAWGVDWYCFSTYKVYGPHMAALYGSDAAWGDIVGPNHAWIDDADIPYKFELGGVAHESAAGLCGLPEYLRFLGGAKGSGFTREVVTRAFDLMTAMELPLQKRLIDFLRDHPRVRLVGPDSSGTERVATVSFVHESLSSREIAQTANEQGFGLRHGHFYACRLARALGLDPADGVVRVSMVHYNTPEEVDRLIEYFEGAM